jgi:PAS domain S-box-containing protein
VSGPSTPVSEVRLASIVESSDDAIITKDRDGIITSWNPAAERMYGYSAEEAIGRPISILIPEHRAGEERRILERVLAGERVDHYESERVHRSGRLLSARSASRRSPTRAANSSAPPSSRGT